MGLSFARGMLASINPCAFVLLPTYLMYFLGLEGQRPGTQRASVRRALIVAGSVSAGFLTVFFVAGLISQLLTKWIDANSRFVTAFIGAAFLLLGVAMLFGYKLSIATPQLNVGGRDRTMRAMFLYGIAYAVASLGCTIPLFMATLFGSINSGGWVAGVLNVVAYGAGMALVVSALTVAMAFARTGLLTLLRSGSKYIDKLTAILLILSGLYLLYYFWVVDVKGTSPPIVSAMYRFRDRVVLWVNNYWQVIGVVLVITVAGSAYYAFNRRHASSAGSVGSERT